ncbi:MAG: diaminopimelate epimerase, partial [Candidatus Marinamargulisbacteria bacterium]
SKMHGLGNDFILINALDQRLDDFNLSEVSQQLCDRRMGVGADGVIYVLKSDQSDLQMRVYNSDGSEPEMCGNGIRCFAKYAYDEKIVDREVFSVETAAGIMVPALIVNEGRVNAVEVDMGEPSLEKSALSMTAGEKTQFINEPLIVDGLSFDVTCVSMGNPHAVVFVDDLKTIDLERLGPLFEKHEAFPKKTNVEFVQVISDSEAVVIVWERGAGETMACGTGACASVVAGVLNQKLSRKVNVHLPGGTLRIEWQASDKHVMMMGPATNVFKGEITL